MSGEQQESKGGQHFTPTHKTIIACALIGVMGGLAAIGKGFDTVGLLALLGGLGWVVSKQGENNATTQAVKEQTNGNTTKMLETIERQNDRMTEILSRLPALPPEPPRDNDATR